MIEGQSGQTAGDTMDCHRNGIRLRNRRPLATVAAEFVAAGSAYGPVNLIIRPPSSALRPPSSRVFGIEDLTRNLASNLPVTSESPSERGTGRAHESAEHSTTDHHADEERGCFRGLHGADGSLA